MKIPALFLSDALVDRVIEYAKQTPFSHLRHADGTPYMERYWIRPYNPARRDAMAIRLHHIASADVDRVLHDHPWPFWSIILRGGYVEERPVDKGHPVFEGGEELTYKTVHRQGAVLRRLATDRHRITHVFPDTWTLFITGPQAHWWGFYTPTGKIYHRDFDSNHTAGS